MPSVEKFALVANMIMGDRPEPFLPYCLESIKDAVDLVVLNDNSNNPSNLNMDKVKASALYKAGKIEIVFSEFESCGGFAGARNLCLDRVKELLGYGALPGQNLWILYIDCDEVHFPNFIEFARGYLSKTPADVGIVDGYMYQFILTFDFYTTLERRHNLLFRFHPEIRWIKPVHETLTNLVGKRIATGYTYCHYGYLLPPKDLLGRWKLYDKYDGLDFNLEKVKKEEMLMDKSTLAIPFKKEHPPIMKEYIEKFNDEMCDLNRKFIDKINIERRNPILRAKNFLRHVNYEIRLKFRDLQSKR